MRSTTTFIRRHIYGLAPGEIFTTRHCLSYGRRSAVDQALARLVKQGLIIRLARGVFVREGCPRPSALAVASAKARAFGKQLAVHAHNLACELGLTGSASDGSTFAVPGSSSSFKFGALTVNFRRTAPRKLALGSSRAGQVLRALWQLGEAAVDGQCLMTAAMALSRSDRQEVRLSAGLLPAWLTDRLIA